MKTCEDGPCSRCRRRRSRISSPCIGWTLGEPYIVHKRKSFEHEQEFRAVVYCNETCAFDRVGQKGLLVPIDIAKLIEEIFVSPTSQSPLLEVVAGLTKKYGLKATVLRSRVNDEPAW
jgi:hypothetical protein